MCLLLVYISAVLQIAIFFDIGCDFAVLLFVCEARYLVQKYHFRMEFTNSCVIVSYMKRFYNFQFSISVENHFERIHNEAAKLSSESEYEISNYFDHCFGFMELLH